MYSNLQPYVPDRKPPMGAILNPHLAINRGLVLDMIMWEGAGGKVFDLSGNGIDLSFTNSPVWSKSSLGSCVLFDDGSSQYAVSTNTSVTDYPLTMVAWFISDDDTATQTVMSISDAADNDHQDALLLWGSVAGDYVGAETRAGGAWVGPKTTVPFVANQLHCIAGVFRSTTSREVYLDGGNKVTDTGEAIPTARTRIGIGALTDINPSAYMSGKVVFALLYNRALSASEIAQLYREPFCGFRWPNIVELAAYVAAGGMNMPLLMQQMGQFDGGMAA